MMRLPTLRKLIQIMLELKTAIEKKKGFYFKANYNFKFIMQSLSALCDLQINKLLTSSSLK